MHIFPQLRKLEDKHSKSLVVVGVHSPKFKAEQETKALREAILRHDITHPVVNDRNFDIWQRYSCRAWPTIMLIDPQGYIIGKHEGEFTADSLDPVIQQMVDTFTAQGLMDSSRVALKKEQEGTPALRYPGKLLYGQ